MKTLKRLSAATLSVLAAGLLSGCNTYNQATSDVRHLPTFWEPSYFEAGPNPVAVVSLPDAHYAGRTWGQLH